jgi:hypothetical protein
VYESAYLHTLALVVVVVVVARRSSSCFLASDTLEAAGRSSASRSCIAQPPLKIFATSAFDIWVLLPFACVCLCVCLWSWRSWRSCTSISTGSFQICKTHRHNNRSGVRSTDCARWRIVVALRIRYKRLKRSPAMLRVRCEAEG